MSISGRNLADCILIEWIPILREPSYCVIPIAIFPYVIVFVPQCYGHISAITQKGFRFDSELYTTSNNPLLSNHSEQ